MNPVAKNLTFKYLKNHSVGIDLSQWPKSLSWKHALIIPVCGEATDMLCQVLQNQLDQSVLIVMIINRPAGNQHSDQWFNENYLLSEYLRSHSKQQKKITKQHQLLLNCMGFDVLILDYNEAPFQTQKGVGLARKIAADTALELIHAGVVKTPWIFSTDADVVLPADYFEAVTGVPENVAALSLPFKHVSGDDDALKLQQKYDFKLKYYQRGVHFVGSKYHYIPLGSTLVIDAVAYAKVRGFPCRSGGEDFYILNKLAKTGHIHQPKSTVVDINIRFSNRVPFGTGPALTKIQQQQVAGEELTYYHPAIFHILKRWHQALCDFYTEMQLPCEDYGLNQYWQIESVLKKAMLQTQSDFRWQQFVHEWFDAFRILKSVHYLRDEIASLTYEELLNAPEYLKLLDS